MIDKYDLKENNSKINNYFSHLLSVLISRDIYILKLCHISVTMTTACFLSIQILEKVFATIVTFLSLAESFVVLRIEHPQRFTPESDVHYWFKSKFNIGVRTDSPLRSSITLERETHSTGRERRYTHASQGRCTMHNAPAIGDAKSACRLRR